MNYKIQTEKSARSAESARGFLNKITTKICHPEERRVTKETPQSKSPIFVELLAGIPRSSGWQNDDKSMRVTNIIK